VKADEGYYLPPGTVGCAVIPQLGKLALWMIGLILRLVKLCDG